MKFSSYSLMSFLSMVVPAIFPILVLSLSARYLADGEFGAYLIVMTVLGYSGLLELGLSRALIKQFSCEHDDRNEILVTFSTGFYTMLGLGALAATILTLALTLAPLLSFSIPETIRNGVKISALALPAILLAQVFYAYLEGTLKYSSILRIKLLCSGLEALFLILALLLYADLVALMTAFVLGKYLSLIAISVYCSGWRFIHLENFSKSKVKYMITFGGWLTLSSIIGPVMVYFDRFFVSYSLGVQESEQYLAVSELAVKVAIIPAAIARVVFVLMSRVSPIENRKSKLGYRPILVCVVPFLFVLMMFAEPILNIIISNRVTEISVLAFRILCIGLLFNAVAQIPFVKLLADGRSRTTAIIHLVELFPYLIILYLTVDKFGIVGVAVLWTLRAIVDCCAMYLASRRINLEVKRI